MSIKTKVFKDIEEYQRVIKRFKMPTWFGNKYMPYPKWDYELANTVKTQIRKVRNTCNPSSSSFQKSVSSDYLLEKGVELADIQLLESDEKKRVADMGENYWKVFKKKKKRHKNPLKFHKKYVLKESNPN